MNENTDACYSRQEKKLSDVWSTSPSQSSSERLTVVNLLHNSNIWVPLSIITALGLELICTQAGIATVPTLSTSIIH